MSIHIYNLTLGGDMSHTLVVGWLDGQVVKSCNRNAISKHSLNGRFVWFSSSNYKTHGFHRKIININTDFDAGMTLSSLRESGYLFPTCKVNIG